MTHPVTIDECDISDSGYCVGPELGCVACRCDTPTRYSALSMDVSCLECDSCMEPLASWETWSGRAA